MNACPGMTIWKLYTERRDNLTEIVARHFDGATLTPATGLWRGKTEASMVIEIIEDDPGIPENPPYTLGGRRNSADRIAALARDIATTNAQESVLVSRSPAVVFSYDNRDYASGSGVAGDNAPFTPENTPV
ncbi:MAG: hypothetical protein Q7R41_17280 [Phycisphaerales bacterium]|nr:hypothetical protein [Phycisphaerales bacterium]